MRIINLNGALVASIVMLTLLFMDKMNEGYFGIYLAAVGLTTVGYKYATNSSNGNSRTVDVTSPKE